MPCVNKERYVGVIVKQNLILKQEQQFSATSCVLKRYTDLFYMNQSVIQTLSKDMD